MRHRSMEGGEIDQGNANFGGQEAMVILENVFIPNALVFMDGETEFASMLVERFTCYHRRSYVCKSGVGDVLIGAAATVAEYNGAEKASHIKDKLVEMTHLMRRFTRPELRLRTVETDKSGAYLMTI